MQQSDARFPVERLDSFAQGVTAVHAYLFPQYARLHAVMMSYTCSVQHKVHEGSGHMLGHMFALC